MKITQTKERKIYNAVHEAGHAVILWVQGFTLFKVSIVSAPAEKPGCGGYVNFLLGDSVSLKSIAADTARFTSQRVFALMGGRAATDIYCHRPRHGSDFSDFKTIFELVQPDPDTLDMLKFLKDNPNTTADDFYTFNKEPIVEVLRMPQAKKALKALTRQLLKAGTLTGVETVEIISRAWGHPPPPRALPPADHAPAPINGPKSYDELIPTIKAHIFLIASAIESVKSTCTPGDAAALEAILCNLKNFEGFFKSKTDRPA